MHCMLWTILHVLYWKGSSGLYWYMPCVPRALDVCTVSQFPHPLLSPPIYITCVYVTCQHFRIMYYGYI